MISAGQRRFAIASSGTRAIGPRVPAERNVIIAHHSVRQSTIRRDVAQLASAREQVSGGGRFPGSTPRGGHGHQVTEGRSRAGPSSPAGRRNVLRDYSRVLEIDPTTLEIVWQYTPKEAGFVQPLDASRFYSPFIKIGRAS